MRAVSFSGVNLVHIWFCGESHMLPYLQNWSIEGFIIRLFGKTYPVHVCKAGSTRCVVRIRGASCLNVSKRFVESDIYSLLWCVNLPPNWQTRCDEWTNDTSTQLRHIFSYTRCANHNVWRITKTNHVSCGPSLRLCCKVIFENENTMWAFKNYSDNILCITYHLFDMKHYWTRWNETNSIV